LIGAAQLLELLVDQVDRDHAATGDRCIVERQVSQATDAEHGNQVGGARPGNLDPLVRRHPDARQRRGVERVDPDGHLGSVAGVGDRVLAKPAVDPVAGVFLLQARRFPTGHAGVAGAARITQPRHRDPVAEHDLGHPGPELDNGPDSLMAWDESRRGLDRPVPARGMDVCVA
jgi:hypothetical protein